METPIISDFRKPQLSKTEKAIAMLEAQNGQLQAWAMGLQRQIAGLLLHLNVSPNQFAINTRNQEGINKFLEETQKAEDLMMQAEKREMEEKAKAPIVKLNENGTTKDDKNIGKNGD